MGFTYIWFMTGWGKKDVRLKLLKEEGKKKLERQTIEIVVDGGYRPETVAVDKGARTTISFLRKDPSSCLEEVVLPEFGIKKFLPLGKKVEVSFVPDKAGTFNFSCGMRMFHGKIVVTDQPPRLHL